MNFIFSPVEQADLCMGGNFFEFFEFAKMLLEFFFVVLSKLIKAFVDMVKPFSELR